MSGGSSAVDVAIMGFSEAEGEQVALFPCFFGEEISILTRLLTHSLLVNALLSSP